MSDLLRPDTPLAEHTVDGTRMAVYPTRVEIETGRITLRAELPAVGTPERRAVVEAIAGGGAPTNFVLEDWADVVEDIVTDAVKALNAETPEESAAIVDANLRRMGSAGLTDDRGQPIGSADLRPGDKTRVEWVGVVKSNSRTGIPLFDAGPFDDAGGLRYFLLDRPDPDPEQVAAVQRVLDGMNGRDLLLTDDNAAAELVRAGLAATGG